VGKIGHRITELPGVTNVSQYPRPTARLTSTPTAGFLSSSLPFFFFLFLIELPRFLYLTVFAFALSASLLDSAYLSLTLLLFSSVTIGLSPCFTRTSLRHLELHLLKDLLLLR
jgi:hypothetical protein